MTTISYVHDACRDEVVVRSSVCEENGFPWIGDPLGSLAYAGNRLGLAGGGLFALLCFARMLRCL